MKETIVKINKTKSWFFEKINKIISTSFNGKNNIFYPNPVSSVAQLCLTLCDPMDCSVPGLPVHHQLAEFTQTHVHRVGDAIQPSQHLSSPSSPAFNLSQHQGSFQRSQFFTSGGQSIGPTVSVLPMNTQD